MATTIKIGKEALRVLSFVSEGEGKDGSKLEVREDKHSKLRVHFRLSKNKPGGEFLPGLVEDAEGKVHWRYQEENFKKGIARVAVLGNEVLILLVDWHHLYKVIPIIDLPARMTISTTNGPMVIGGRSTSELALLKYKIADALQVEAVVTDEEKATLKELRSSDEAAKRVAQQEALVARKEENDAIMNRPKISIFWQERCLSGIPVIDGEWEFLEKGTRVIRFSKLDEANKPVDETGEAFFVGNANGKPIPVGLKKGVLRRSVYVNKPAPVATVDECKLGVIVATKTTSNIPAGPHECLLTSREGFDTLRKAGANSGMIVAFPDPNGSDRVQAHRLKGSECTTLGLFDFKGVEVKK